MKCKDMIPLVEHFSQKCVDMLQQRNNLSQEDLEYCVATVSKLKDERLKQCFATLIGWGDEESEELETFCAIALEVMKNTRPSRIRDAAATVEIKFRMKNASNPS